MKDKGAYVWGTGQVIVFVPQVGDERSMIVPESSPRAVDLWVSGNDVPPAQRGYHVPRPFEGWTAAALADTFGGEVIRIDHTAGPTRKFRILVKEAANNSWPDEHYMRQGVRANSWVITEAH